MNIIVAYILILIGFVIFSVGMYYISNASANCITKDGILQPDNRDSYRIGGGFGTTFGLIFMIMGIVAGVTSK
jgi:hypothetical protein